jgi:GAF domain-containing protein
VLQVISSSPGDLQSVFATMLENAVRICQANFGNMYLWNGQTFDLAANFSTPSDLVEYRRRSPVRPTPENSFGRVLATKAYVQIADLANAKAYVEQRDPSTVASVELGGIRTLVVVPMLKDDELIGLLTVYRQEVRAFTEKQIELVQNFATQAVIAIENARLLTELRESLEQQTATADVLQVISSSPGDLEPVFATMLKNAVRICDAKFGNMYRLEGDGFSLVATINTPAIFVEARKHAPWRPSLTGVGRFISTKAVVHIADLAAEPDYAERRIAGTAEAIELGGIRTLLVVPMVKENELVGALTLSRQEVRPFTDKQIALVENFAAQAVIAIENARLLTELRQSLEQQTATAEVLGVISSSKFELQPILQSVVDTAARLCRADAAVIFRLEDGLYRFAAGYSLDPAYLEIERRTLIAPGLGTLVGRAAMSRQVARIDDALSDPLYEKKEQAKLGPGFRSMMGVPLLRDGEAIGVIGLARSRVEPFAEREVDLVTTFADQAVIAIENVRLFEAEQERTQELTESLEQQTATSEVLQVISSSPGDLEPVFASMLENAIRICDAKFGNIYRWDGQVFHTLATHNAPAAFAEARKRSPQTPPHPQSMFGRIAVTKSVIHFADTLEQAAYRERVPSTVAAAELGGVRTALGVPMLKENELIGAFTLFRHEVRPFTEKQIALVTSFAAQAVIAIENARLLSELRQRTDDLGRSVGELRALGDVSQAVNSTLDLETVLDTIVAKAVQLSNTDAGAIYVYGEHDREFHLRATYGMDPDLIDALSRACGARERPLPIAG